MTDHDRKYGTVQFSRFPEFSTVEVTALAPFGRPVVRHSAKRLLGKEALEVWNRAVGLWHSARTIEQGTTYGIVCKTLALHGLRSPSEVGAGR